MIVGIVSPFREATIRLRLRGISGQVVEVEAIIDTGFTDFLTLSLALIRSLGFPFVGPVRVALADASEADLDSHMAEVDWDGRTLAVPALAADGDPLVGMSLLYGHELKLWVVDGGSVVIERFP